MTILEILFIGVGLSMDAVAVSMTNGMVYRDLNKRRIIAQPLLFGGFQGIMPILGGFLAGGIFAEAVTRYAGIIIFIILGIIGGKMLKEGMEKRNAEICYKTELPYKVLFFQGIATSIDAFAVGIGLRLLKVDLLSASAIIAGTTLILVIVALLIGRKFGDYLGCKAEILGGVILILIGLKALL